MKHLNKENLNWMSTVVTAKGVCRRRVHVCVFFNQQMKGLLMLVSIRIIVSQGGWIQENLHCLHGRHGNTAAFFCFYALKRL